MIFDRCIISYRAMAQQSFQQPNDLQGSLNVIGHVDHNLL